MAATLTETRIGSSSANEYDDCEDDEEEEEKEERFDP